MSAEKLNCLLFEQYFGNVKQWCVSEQRTTIIVNSFQEEFTLLFG